MDIAGTGGLIAGLFVVGLIGVSVVVVAWYLLARSDRRR
jgi:hypothetical protein